MMTLAHPPNRWEPDTATAAVLSALRPAAIPNGVVKSIADTPATEPWYGSKDGFCAPVRQEGSWWGASALRQGSEMDDPIAFTYNLGCKMRKRLDAAVWAKSGGKCWYCGCRVTIDAVNVPDRMRIDHLHSQALGGGDDLSNLVPTCLSCNSAKGPRDVEVFRWTGYRKERGLPNFSLEQRQWLCARGFVFEGLAEFRFWFEREGLS
jgi:hypothetical protein